MGYLDIIKAGLLTISIIFTTAGIIVTFQRLPANGSSVSQFQLASSQTGWEATRLGGKPGQTSYQIVSENPQAAGAPGQSSPNDGNTGGNSGNSGNTGHINPEINAVAAPTALSLLIGGVLLLGERSRRTRQISVQSKSKLPGLTV